MKSLNTHVILQRSVRRSGDYMRVAAPFLLCFFLISFNTLAVDVDAGEDQVGCPGETLTIGGDPTAGPDPVGSYTFEWTSSDGSFSSSEPNPTITVGDTEVTYTVIVEDQDGFRCDDTMVVTPVEIGEVTFSPEALPSDGSSTATASATITPGDRTIKWSIEGNTYGATIDENTGVVTAGTEPGTVIVRATDSEAPEGSESCYQEAPLCIGDEDCCREIQSVTFGPITASFAAMVQSKGQDDDGYCLYEVSNASIPIQMTGVFDKSYSLDGVSLSWREKQTDGGNIDFKDVTINWEGQAPTRTFGALQANLTGMSLTVSPSGALSGSTTFTVNQVNDVNVGGIAVLKAGTSGTFTYEYASSNSFVGDWDFGGISGINIVLKKQSYIIGKLTGSMDTDGNLIADFTAEAPGTWTTNGFQATLLQLDLGMTYNIADSEIAFTGGTGRAKLTDIQNVEGEFTLELVFSSSSVTATVAMEGAEAFGCTVEGSLTADFTFSFDLTSLVGSGISAKHSEFEQAFSGVGFEIRNGALERFDIGNVEVKYKNINFTMANASYNKGQGRLTFDANVVVPSLEMDVTEFVITSDGHISVGRIMVDFDRSPVTVNGSAEFNDSEFRGEYSGSFRGGVSIGGALVVGSTGTFNYAYFALQLGSARGGVPLGASGLKVNKLGGEFGYNWSPGDSFGSISGSPSQGTTVIGFLLGIGDVANLAAIEGSIRLTLGSSSAIDLEGALKVTASAPHYLQGNLQVNYVLGSYEISGSLSSNIQIPASSGSAVSLNTGSINFGIGNNRWYVNANGMNGQIFSTIDVQGGISLNSPLSNIGGMTGSLNGSLSYDNEFSYTYPSGFNPSSCASADDTDNFFGFGITGTLAVHLGGSMSAQLNNSGVTGTISAEASGASNMYVKWPCVFCGDDCVSNYNTAMSGLISLEYNGSQTRLFGEVMFSSGGETEKGDVDFTF